jgi:DNA-binding transcriptional regulator YiaG
VSGLAGSSGRQASQIEQWHIERETRSPDAEFQGGLGPLALHIAKEAAEREVETKVRQQVTPAQCRAARALIGISQAEFARAAVVPRNVVIDFEVSSLKPRPAYLEAIQRTLESAGVEFIDVGDRPEARPKRGASSSV